MDGQNYTDREQELEIDVPLDENGELKFRRGYDYLPYTSGRIKRILKEHFNAELENIWFGYKGHRFEGYVEHYRVIDCNTKEVLNACATLDGLRRFLARNHFPLRDEKSECYRNINFKAVEFMDALRERYGEENVIDE